MIFISGLTLTWDVFKYGKVEYEGPEPIRLTLTWDVFKFSSWWVGFR